MTRSGDLEHLREQPVLGVEARDSAVVVRLGGELDIYNAPIVGEALTGVADSKPDRLVVDLSEVSFVDSTVLGVMVEARTRLPNRRAFLLAAPRPETRRALEVTGLDRQLVVYDSVDDALRARVATAEAVDGPDQTEPGRRPRS
jgi:anti-sigma B factor antagonist